MHAEVRKYHIPGQSGWQITVELTFHDDDDVIIAQNGMVGQHDVTIFTSADGKTVWHLSDFYGRPPHFRILDLNLSATQADMVIAGLKVGFAKCKRYIAENRRRS